MYIFLLVAPSTDSFPVHLTNYHFWCSQTVKIKQVSLQFNGKKYSKIKCNLLII